MPPYAMRDFPAGAAHVRVAAVASVAMEAVFRNDLRSIFNSGGVLIRGGRSGNRKGSSVIGSRPSADLELEASRELDQTRVVGIGGTGDRAESAHRRESGHRIARTGRIGTTAWRQGERRVRIDELRRIQHVESFRMELQLQP